MKRLLLLMCIFSTLCADFQTPFQYGKAVSEAQRGDWQAAEQQMHKLLIHNPENEQLLYDLGVACYNTQKFDTAAVYFDTVANRSGVSVSLKEQALFNLANTKTAQKKLPEAITHYEAVLSLNPENERARHNLELVKKMLEQKKEEEQQQKDSKNSSQDQENDDREQDDQQSQSDKDQNDMQSGQQSQKSNDKKNNNGNRKEQDQGSSADTTQDGSKKPEDAKGDQKSGDKALNASDQKKAKQNPSDDQKGKSSGIKDDRGNKKDLEGKSSSKDASQSGSDAQQNGSADGKAVDSQSIHGQDAQFGKDMSQKDRVILEVMQWQENLDAQTQKQLMQRAINKGGASDHGKNRW
jgi:tetratricopeptide (TPR) repeat protein